MSSALLVCPELVTWRAIDSGMLPPQTPSALLHLRDCPRCQSQARQALGQRDPLTYLVGKLAPGAAHDEELQQALAVLCAETAADAPASAAPALPKRAGLENLLVSVAAALVLAGIVALIVFTAR